MPTNIGRRGTSPVDRVVDGRGGNQDSIDVEVVHIPTVTVGIHDVVPARSRNELVGIQINP